MRVAIRVFALTCITASLGFALTQDDLFDASVLHEVRLTVHPSDWQTLRDNYLEDLYFPALLEWRGMIVEDVAIRSRGLGSRSFEKPGLRVDFNRFAAGREFLGLKSLVLDNMTQDGTMMAERLSMEMFRRMGLPAPRIAHARLYVNGSYAGLYAIVERVDKSFLKRNFGEDGGYLYDYEWFMEYWFEYLGPDPGNYVPAPFEPTTNESDPRPGSLVDMIRTMNESSDEDFAAAISVYLDLKRVATYLAAETFIAEIDGLAGEWGVNNFYLYQFRDGNRFEFIPWDKDVTFLYGFVYRPIWAHTDRTVLLRRMMALPEIRAHYLAELEKAMEIAGGPGGWLEQEISRVYQQIRGAVLDDRQKTYTNAEFEEAVAAMQAFLFERQRFLLAEIADASH